MKHNKSDKKDLLSTHLYPKDFQFNVLEMTQISAKVMKCSTLFTDINGFKNPLDALSKESFLYKNKEEARPIVEQYLKSFISRARKIQQTALVDIGQYKDQLEVNFYQYDRTIGQQIISLEKTLATYESNLLHKQSILAGDKEAIFASYNQLQKTYAASPYFEFSFGANTGKIDHIHTSLRSFKET